MSLVISDAKAEDNGDFNEALESDHEGSESSSLTYPLFTENTPIRNAVADVLNDPVPFIFGNSLKPMNTNHEPAGYYNQPISPSIAAV